MFSPLRRQVQLSATSKIYQNVDFSLPSFLKSFLEYHGYYIENSDLFLKFFNIFHCWHSYCLRRHVMSAARRAKSASEEKAI